MYVNLELKGDLASKLEKQRIMTGNARSTILRQALFEYLERTLLEEITVQTQIDGNKN